MRVVYVINSLEGGGAASPVPAVARVLQSQGCEVEILALTPRDLRGLPAIRDAGLRVTIRDGGRHDHFAALRWLDRRVMQTQPDLIWTSLTRATLLGQIVGQRHAIDVVSWQHSARLKRVNAWLLKARQAHSLLWVADSDDVAALTHRRLGIERDRIAVWPLFSADDHAPRGTPWRPGQPIRIGSLGRLHPNKGYDVLIAALARLRADGFTPPAPIEIAIAGDGALHDALMRDALAAGLDNLRFIGFAEPRGFLAGLNLYVQPSRKEGLCIAAHEAMQAGLPVIASAVGQMPHSIIDGVTGRVVPPADSAALAGALAEMVRSPDRLAEMGGRARTRVLDLFGGDSFAQAGIRAFDRVLRIRADRARDANLSASRAPNGRSA
jgi:glycosyltransferase involved in cell wall biosynthesis